jgi:hypothetical protein
LLRLKEIIPFGISLTGDTDFTRRVGVTTVAVPNIEQG